jgi:NitT/TauT family transport system ATP-binding protein
MQQRLQLARALTRADLEDQLLTIWTADPKTIIFVTHDIDEAVYLSDRVLVLSARPSVVLDELTIDLPRPRDQLETRNLARFNEYRGHIYRRIKQGARPPELVA